MRKITIDGIEYYSRSTPSGYGFEIMKIVDKKYYLVFRSIDKELVSSYMDRFMEGEVVTDFPDTSHEKLPNKILVYNSKHFTYHYSVPTLESLDKTFRHILKQEYGTLVDIENMNPNNTIENNSGVNSQDEIDSIPVEAVRNDIQEKWNSYQKEIRRNTEELKDYNNLKAVLTDNGGNARYAMDTYECERWELEDLMVVE